jgi:cobalt-zinc-cadmium efflux system protein
VKREERHVHDHHAPDGLPERRALFVAFGLIGAFTVGEIVAALGAHSLALLSDAGHMLVDLGAILGALAAARVATRPASVTMTFGYRRSEILAASVNGAVLVALAVALALGAVVRLVHPHHVSGVTVAVVGAIGFVVNGAAAASLLRANGASLNARAVLAHVLTDAAAFGATIGAGVVIATTGFRRADAIASLFVAMLMVRAAYGLLRPALRILAEGAPPEIDLGEVRAHMLGVPHVDSVHDLHAWTVSDGLPVLSAHVVIDPGCATSLDAHQVLDELQGCLVEHFDLAHSTIQLEVAGHLDHEAPHHE